MLGVRVPLPLPGAFSSVELERQAANLEARGSSPLTLTTFRGRLAVGPGPLEPMSEVRILAPEPSGWQSKCASSYPWCVRSGVRTPDCQSGGDEFESRTHRKRKEEGRIMNYEGGGAS